MYELFGEFDSVEELNEAAEGQKEQGDKKALFELAKENGIDQEDAEDYFDGSADKLATALMAALGKLEMEAQILKPKEIMEDWLSYIKIRCTEDEAMARAVKKKEKSLKGCIAELLKWSFKNQIQIEDGILKAAGVSNAKVTLGIPGIGTAKKIITEYYL